MTKVIFFGTPDYVVPILKKLDKYYEVVAVVTQPPKLVGREQFKKYSPVDDWAHKHNVPIFFNFEKPLPEAELGICAAYGKIVPESIIKAFKFGLLNIHPSLLPKYRGASPIPEAIKNGDLETGVTIIKMDKEMDHGPIVTKFKEEILNTDTSETLRTRLFERSTEALIQLIPAYMAGKVKPKEQNHDEATFTKVLTRDDGYLDLKTLSPEEANRFVRAMTPWPGAWTKVELKPKEWPKRIKILKAHLEENKLILDEVQLEGKDPVSGKQFKEGYPNAVFL